jgi:hypothetical protein
MFDITITILEIIHRPDFYLNHDISKTVFFLRNIVFLNKNKNIAIIILIYHRHKRMNLKYI